MSLFSLYDHLSLLSPIRYGVLPSSVIYHLLSVSVVSAHAWRGQEIVLFITYDLSGDQAKGTLGIPLDLIDDLQPRDRSLANTNGDRRRLFSHWRSSERIPTNIEALLNTLSKQIRRGLSARFDTQEVSPEIGKIDLILRHKGELDSLAIQRDIKTWEGVTVELHSGQQDAVITTFTYPVNDFEQVRSARFLWQNHAWFVKPTTAPRHRSPQRMLHTNKEAPGLIIDRQQITPITFRPHEPEVIWRSPTHIKRLKEKMLEGSKSVEKPATHIPQGQSWGAWIISFFQDEAPLAVEHLNRFKALHRKIYSAFDHESDELAYQSLSNILHGELLDQVFQSTYQALILRDQGGARAKVSHVIPLELSNKVQSKLTPLVTQAINESKRSLKHSDAISSPDQHEIFYYRWRVVGVVEHWGHTHRRVNDYEAVYLMSRLKRGWRLSYVRPLSQKRRPELEGSL